MRYMSFSEFWKYQKSHDVGIQDKLDSVKEEVHEMDEQLDTIVEEAKPGAESKKAQNNPWDICHSQNLEGGKFESCVLQLKEKFGIAKSMTEDEYNKDVGVPFAGPIPQSKLARQDLEGEKTTKMQKSQDNQTIKYRGYNIVMTVQDDGNLIYKTPTGECVDSFEMARGIIDEILNSKGAMKSADSVTATANKLDDLKDKADETAMDEADKYNIIERIKNTQEKRQAAIINARKNGNMTKFRDIISGNNG